MGVSTKKKVRNNVRVEMRFNPKIGPGPIRDYNETLRRCEKINSLLSPIGLSCISFGNPYTYETNYGKVSTKFVFEVDEKEWLPENKRKDLAKILSSKGMKNLGVTSFKIQTVKETVTTRRELSEG